jgi:hypothetical protein
MSVAAVVYCCPHVQDLSVLLNGPLRGLAPGVQTRHSLSARHANAFPKLGVFQPAAKGDHQRVNVAGLAPQDGLAVNARNLG